MQAQETRHLEFDLVPRRVTHHHVEPRALPVKHARELQRPVEEAVAVGDAPRTVNGLDNLTELAPSHDGCCVALQCMASALQPERFSSPQVEGVSKPIGCVDKIGVQFLRMLHLLRGTVWHIRQLPL